jgi:hypothetical protein
MKRNLFLFPLLIGICFYLSHTGVRADGRPGTVTWSDGRKMSGNLSLTPGKALLIFTGTKGQVSVQLDQVREIIFQPEKEEIREGFYFPNAGQATQAKTGDAYPVRYLKTKITLSNGSEVEGHLFTTTLYVETDDSTQKVVLMAKQTGENGQKLADVPNPTSIEFKGAAPTRSSRIDLTQAGLSDPQSPIVISRPNLTVLPTQQIDDLATWTVPFAGDLLFAVTAADGIHVAWPEQAADAPTQMAIEKALKEMQDFYDTRTLLACFADPDAGDVYSLVMMERMGPTNDFSTEKKPWSLVILRWKYDTEEKRATLLNRVSLGMGRVEGHSPLPVISRSAALLKDITSNPDAEGAKP